MANISKQKQYAILWLNNQDKNSKEISEELDVSIEQVDKIIEKNSKSNNIVTSSQPVSAKKPSLKDNMITKSATGKQNVAIMTKEASEISDEATKRHIKPDKQNHSSFIFKPVED